MSVFDQISLDPMIQFFANNTGRAFSILLLCGGPSVSASALYDLARSLVGLPR